MKAEVNIIICISKTKNVTYIYWLSINTIKHLKQFISSKQFWYSYTNQIKYIL